MQSGRQPTETRPISSIVGDVLTADGAIDHLDISEQEPFSMTLLHFRRTFVEKLFAIHGKVERLKQEGVPLGRDVRHYADLHVLAGDTQVIEMLSSPEYESIRLDYDEKSRAHFAGSYRPPKGSELRFKRRAVPVRGAASSYRAGLRRRVPSAVLPVASALCRRVGALSEHPRVAVVRDP